MTKHKNPRHPKTYYLGTKDIQQHRYIFMNLSLCYSVFVDIILSLELQKIRIPSISV